MRSTRAAPAPTNWGEPPWGLITGFRSGRLVAACLVRRPSSIYKPYLAKAVSKSRKKARFANRMSKKACRGANVPQSASNLKETGIFPLLIQAVFVL